jgi:hypothetical protein
MIKKKDIGDHISDLQVASGTLGLLALVILGIVAAAITVHSRRSRVMVIVYVFICYFVCLL